MVHEDDKETIKYLRNKNFTQTHAVLDNYKKPVFSKMFNKLYAETPFTDAGTIVGFFEDDFICETPGWDKIIIDKMNEIQGFGVIYCKDGIQNGKIAVNNFISRETINIIGTYQWDTEPQQWVDVVWTEIGKAIGLYYLEDVLITHKHFSKNDKIKDMATQRIAFEIRHAQKDKAKEYAQRCKIKFEGVFYE